MAADPEPRLGTRRISLTYPLINAARRVLFLVSGSEKTETLRAVLAGPTDPLHLPSQGVHPTAGNLIWLVDAAAYSAIQQETE